MLDVRFCDIAAKRQGVSTTNGLQHVSSHPIGGFSDGKAKTGRHPVWIRCRGAPAIEGLPVTPDPDTAAPSDKSYCSSAHLSDIDSLSPAPPPVPDRSQ
ncbi:hypothetical protein CDD83_7973 [Cordyceps sp. RAO-2017]|nr:hypothetical protein CDD83_7973 [Cordyceps sp. RAO-2017]